MLTLLLGKDWKANRAEVLRRISEDVKNEKPGRILIVPELISHDTERRLCQTAGDTASRYAQVLSFTRLARRVCDLVGNMECMDDGGRLVTMAAAVQNVGSRLKAYASVGTKPEFLLDLVDLVDEFKRCCITSEDLRNAEENCSFPQKIQELSVLMEAYEAQCSKGKQDPRDQMTWVLEQLENTDFAENHVFYIDGFPDFTGQHMKVIQYLMERSSQVVVSMNCDRVDSRLLAFEKAGKTAKALRDYALQKGIEVQTQYIESPRDSLQSVCEALFQGKAELCGQKVELLRATSLHQECQAAAGKVLKLVHSGCRYRDIGLVCGNMEAYGPVLRTVFGKSGIPLYLSGTEEVLQSGVVATALSALDAALGGFEQQQVLRYLRSSLSPLDADTCDLVENYAYIWRVDRKYWKESWKFHPQGLSGQWDEASQAQLARLNAARSLAIDPLVRLEAAFQKAKTVQQQVRAVYNFWEETDFARRIGDLADEMDAAGDSRSAQMLNQLWEIMLTALEQLYGALADTCWDADKFVKLLKLLLSQYNVGSIPAVLDAVSVGPVSAQRCQQQKHLIVLGAEEGAMPGYGGASGLLNNQERMEMRQMGLPMSGGAVDGIQEEFAEIYGCFCGAEESITVLCSGQPSFVFQRLEKMVGTAEFVSDNPAAIITDPAAAGSFLARWEAHDLARELDVQESYLDTLFKKSYHLGAVQPENVRKLYGQRLNLSASQVDKQAVCRLSYFLQYGLRARERKEATVDPAEFGTYVHAVLEKTAREVMDLGGFRSVDLETTLSIARKHSDAYTREHYGQLESQRLQYLFRRNTQELEVVIRELWRELSQSSYTPAAFEMNFGFGEQMAPICIDGGAMPSQLRGLVDRVDIWRKQESTYFRVVDYKTGKKGFDYCDVFNGVGLQMLLYLFALEDGGSQLGDRRVPAGVQYFPARAPYISADSNLSAQEAEKERLKQWKRQGLLLADEASLSAMDPSEKMDTLSCKRKKDGTIEGDLADRVQLGQLKDYVRNLLRDMVDDIASGNVAPNPYSRGTSFDACTFCPYGAICHKDSVENKRNYKTMTAQRFWEEVEKEGASRG